MLKQWLLNDGKTEAIDVEEKYVRWSEELRSDKYKTATRLTCIYNTYYMWSGSDPNSRASYLYIYITLAHIIPYMFYRVLDPR